MNTFRELLETSRAKLKQEYLKGSVNLADIKKAHKTLKMDSKIMLRVNNPKSRTKFGMVTLLDIKKDDLLTTPLATSTDKSAVFTIDDVISFDIYKI